MTTSIKKKSFGQKALTLLRNKNFMTSVLVTLFLVLLFRVISTIPLPGIKINQSSSSSSSTNDFFSLFNLLGGGGLSQLSLFAIGVSPYITSQIIMQLLSTDLIPPLSRLAKSGEIGRRRIEVITRIITLPFAIVQAFAIIELSSNGGAFSLEQPDVAHKAFYIVTMTAGTYISIFIGDIISKRGVGNGVTLLILSGILSQLPAGFVTVFNVITGLVITTNPVLTSIITFSVYVLGFIVLLLATTFINISIRKIPIQQTGQGMTEDLNALPYLPIKINSAGVIPVIFASSIMSIPITIAQFTPQGEARWFVEDYLSLSTPVGITLYGILIILFTFFYSYIQINPEQLSKNFEKSHRFIPGIRPGYETEKHIARVLMRTNFIGAPFLAIIAVIPYVISATMGIPNTLSLGGTGIVIMVAASLELYNSLKSSATTTNYQQMRQQLTESIVNYTALQNDLKLANNESSLPNNNVNENDQTPKDEVSELW
ncbi:preprotein translocase subunit SecY [Mycoplasmoides pirum]|uniref:preprotein translocase subunit SecY n=1 Tax=Mycoplasmoides pirum TaxID=2122 RepID=UPI0009DF6BFB|nr:preprotein translocase subunit SecY [Mycoplasmoides pirum]